MDSGLEVVVIDRKPVKAAVTRYHLKRLGMLVEFASSVKIVVSVCRKMFLNMEVKSNWI
ncbi:hypothetical protein J1N35_046049 [Gossypium stocksii]|uniref:AHK4/CRE1/WOL first receiver domain-containing protein n=1 Tax=Gossypium stocksii TaxID=47602 RepID=A0A9D3U542_9ROSI|nr:hypothetical protein J1N35_046049 [Gossypium stocksii]